MTVFTVTIVQGSYEDRTEEFLVFSSLEKVYEWKNSYRTPYGSYACNGLERAIIKEVSIDDNELLAISDQFILPVEDSEDIDNYHSPLLD